MTWFRIDDSFGTHPKVLGIPRKDRATAIGLWTLAGNFCARHLSDGFLGTHMVEELGVPKKFGLILVKARLWHTEGDDCAPCKEAGVLPLTDGYQFHDWSVYQPTRAAELARREAERQRKADARAEAARKRAESNKQDGGNP